jgi:LPXTG-motif cell wall-anchored protein
MFLAAAFGVCSFGTAWAQQQTKTEEVRQFEIVSVDGNRVVVRGAQGAQEITVPPEFRLTVDGKPVTVAELKPGMKGSATITTTTTTTPVHITEVRNGEVMRVIGNSVVVRGEKGLQMFSPGDLTKRNISIMRDGRPINISELRQGDRLTATIVTSGPPKIVTERDVDAAMTGAPVARTAPSAGAAAGAGAAPAPSGAAGAAAATTGATAPGASTARRLPKTASPLPAIGLFGLASLATGVALTLRRRRRS